MPSLIQRLPTCLTTMLPSVALFFLVTICQPLHAQNQGAITNPASSTGQSRQILTLSRQQGQTSYELAVYANHDLHQSDDGIVRAVVIVHGVKRNAVDYFATGTRLLQLAGLNTQDTLLLAPHFMTHSDNGITPAMPLWGGSRWMQGELSSHGVKNLSTFDALDDIVRTLADRTRFPTLKEIVLIGHSAGAQLMQRYAVLNEIDGSPLMANVSIRYVVSSPSSYLYLDANRISAGRFSVPDETAGCPGYNKYRYGIDKLPTYLTPQAADGKTLFRRYAERRVTYMVGARDTDPAHRFLDKSCGAALQGKTRVERQLAYLQYEKFLSTQWHVPIDHPEFQVPGAGHNAKVLFGNAETARRLFPAPH